MIIDALQRSEHRDGDGLLTGGLGIAALQQPLPAQAVPTAAELRQRAIHANWVNLADLRDGQGMCDFPVVTGREVHAFARLHPGAQRHRLLLQIPDHFDVLRPTLVVCPVSGSRGIYGGLPVGGAFGLPRGYAVVYTDKACGTGLFDPRDGSGVGLDGLRTLDPAAMEFCPAACAATVVSKHAHGGHHPEADWPAYTLQAIEFALDALSDAFPQSPRLSRANTRVIGLGLSNGGGALLRAAELDHAAFDAVIAGAPNVNPLGQPSLYQYGLGAGIWQLAALPQLITGPALSSREALLARAALRHRALADIGQSLSTADALQRLHAHGWLPSALALSGVNQGLFLWPALIASYTPAYARTVAGGPDYGFGLAGDSTPAAHWSSDGMGIAPCPGLSVRAKGDSDDPELAALWRLAEALDDDHDALGNTLRASIAACAATAKLPAIPIHIVHGDADSLIPLNFSSRPYATLAAEQGCVLTLEVVEHGQHIDALLAHPDMASFMPILPRLIAAAARVDLALGAKSPGTQG